MLNVFLLYCSFPVWKTYNVAEMAPPKSLSIKWSNVEPWPIAPVILQNIAAAKIILPYAQKFVLVTLVGHTVTLIDAPVNLNSYNWLWIYYILFYVTICMHLPMSNMTTVIYGNLREHFPLGWPTIKSDPNWMPSFEAWVISTSNDW